VIFARPEVTGATDVGAVLRAPGSVGRAVARAAVAHVTVTALNAHITSDLWAGDIADNATSAQANRTSDYGPCNSP
jgi:hypothetical protein